MGLDWNTPTPAPDTYSVVPTARAWLPALTVGVTVPPLRVARPEARTDPVTSSAAVGEELNTPRDRDDPAVRYSAAPIVSALPLELTVLVSTLPVVSEVVARSVPVTSTVACGDVCPTPILPFASVTKAHTRSACPDPLMAGASSSCADRELDTFALPATSSVYCGEDWNTPTLLPTTYRLEPVGPCPMVSVPEEGATTDAVVTDPAVTVPVTLAVPLTSRVAEGEGWLTPSSGVEPPATYTVDPMVSAVDPGLIAGVLTLGAARAPVKLPVPVTSSAAPGLWVLMPTPVPCTTYSVLAMLVCELELVVCTWLDTILSQYRVPEMCAAPSTSRL